VVVLPVEIAEIESVCVVHEQGRGEFIARRDKSKVATGGFVLCAASVRFRSVEVLSRNER